MRAYPFLVFILFLHWMPAANAQTRNLAYEDTFVWYLSGRLASDLVEFQMKNGLKFDKGEWAEHRTQYEILYHRYLIDCDGPLPKIAEALRFYDPSTESEQDALKVLAFVGGMEHEIWPVSRTWSRKFLIL
jgi:hypothetical protein